MAENWSAIANEAAAAIADVGFDVILTRKVDGPTTPWDTADVVNEAVTLKAIDLRRFRQMMPGATEPQIGRTLLIGAAGTVTPEAGDTLTVRGATFNITRVVPVAPGGSDVLFKVELQT